MLTYDELRKDLAEALAERDDLAARIRELESPPCGCSAIGRLVTVCDAHREVAALRARVKELEEACAGTLK